MIEVKNRDRIQALLNENHMENIFHEPLMPYLSLYTFDPGEHICSQGESAQILYVLVSGKIKIYTTSVEGKTLILSFKTPPEVIGDIEYIRGIDIINTVEAVSSVQMIGIHHRYLHKFGNDHPPLLQFLLDIITRKFFIKSSSLSFNLLHPVEVRLASYLLSVSFEESSDPGKFNISVRDAASLIGTSYRHLNRVILKFCKDGLIERNQGFIHVKDREGLRALAGHNIYE